MPFKSKAQQRFLYAEKPSVAKEFQAKTSKSQQKALPTRAIKKKGKKS